MDSKIMSIRACLKARRVAVSGHSGSPRCMGLPRIPLGLILASRCARGRAHSVGRFSGQALGPAPHRRRGHTLLELMIAVGVFGIVALALSTLLVFSARSLASVANYVELDKENREAMDKLTREIRQARQVMACNSNSITILNGDGDQVSYAFEPLTKRMIRMSSDGSGAQVLLNDCDLLNFGLYQRNPVGGSYDIYPAASGAWQQTVKVVQLTWRTSRTLPGTPIVNSENVQTARIVIRKQRND